MTHGEMKTEDQIEFLRILTCGDTEKALIFLKGPEFDPTGFKNFIFNHDLYFFPPLLGQHFKIGDYLPKSISNEIRGVHLQQWIRNENLSLELETLSDIFTHEQKEVLYLKGYFLAKRFYPPDVKRVSHDIDLLVKKKDVWDIDGFMLEAGYRRDFPKLFGRIFGSYFTHHFSYQKGDTRVEIHWCLERHFSYRINYSALWDEKRPLDWRNRVYFVLSTEYEFVKQILTIFGDGEHGMLKFKSFLDVIMILRGFPGDFNWNEFFDRRKAENIERISINALDLVLELTETQKNFPGLAACLEARRSRILYKDFKQKISLLRWSSLGVHQKKWALRLYECWPGSAIAWWALSLPFRLVFNYHDFKGRLQTYFVSR